MKDDDILRRERFEEAQAGEVAEFLSSMDQDRRIVDADIWVDRAHVIMLSERGILSPKHALAILDALDDIESAGETVLSRGAEDVHVLIETELIERLGEDVGGRMHAGRSRNDEVVACLRVALRDELLGILGRILDLQEIMAEIAGGHLETLMPGYTHLQHAQPTTLAHYLASYVWRLHRDASRIKAAYNGANTNPLGAAAMSSTTLPIDPRITTRLLGFRAVDENSMDSVSSRDFLLESLSAIGILAVTASRLASDLILWSTAEFGFIRLSDAYSSTSSIMPQKRNPDSLELCRARCHTIAGALNAALATCTGLPSTYNRDLQEVTLHLWRGAEATVSTLAVLGGALASATFDPEAMERAASSGMLWATDLADELVMKSNIPFRTAHAVVARVARECEDGYDSPLVARLVRSAVREMTGSDVTIQDSVVEEIMALAPRIADRRGGGPSPRSVARSLERARKAVSRNRNWRQQKLDEIESARAKVRDAQESLRS